MKTETVATPNTDARMPKADAIDKIAKNLVTVRAQLATTQAELKAAVSPDKYRLNFQVNALKKQANFGKAQIARLKKIPATEVAWSDSLFGA
jgi:hypothetical protein